MIERIIKFEKKGPWLMGKKAKKKKIFSSELLFKKGSLSED